MDGDEKTLLLVSHGILPAYIILAIPPLALCPSELRANFVLHCTTLRPNLTVDIVASSWQRPSCLLLRKKLIRARR